MSTAGTRRIRIERLDAPAMAARQRDLATFERAFSYPLGDDRFHIDHGVDYFAFFRALGEPEVLVATMDGELAGVLVAVRRHLPHPVWYLCDLKVAPAAGGLLLARRLLRAWAEPHRARGAGHAAGLPPAFGVSMDRARGENPMRRLARRCAGLEVGPTLGIWSLAHDAFCRLVPLLERALGTIGCHDPRGRKDLVLASSGAPMPLLHVQHGPFVRSDRQSGPRLGFTHMLCLPLADPLAAELRAAGADPAATASVLHVGMHAFAWRHLLTSDI